MKKAFLRFVIVIIALSMVGTLSLVGCQPKTAIETTAATETETVSTAAEATETEAPAQEYSYEAFREMAKNQNYPGEPGKGHTLGFANESAAIGYGKSVQDSLLLNAGLAGYNPKDIYLMDNIYDIGMTMQNADLMIAKNPEAFLEFGMDVDSNVVIGDKFKAAGIPIVFIVVHAGDYDNPSYPMVGSELEKANYKAGEKAIEMIEEKWGGIDNVDLILGGLMAQVGIIVSARTDSFLKAFRDKYGEKVEEKIVTFETGGITDKALKATTEVLAAYPNAKNIVCYSFDTPAIVGNVAAMEAAGIKRENQILIAYDCDPEAQQMIRDGKLDISIPSWPEKYGEYLIPAALALTYGATVPQKMLIEVEDVVTIDNIDKFYPQG